jgi:flavin reductase (DIM6/NTAB) family NADH-FMN oxidoreductase RutF
VNIVQYDMRDAMNASSGPWDKNVDEFDLAEIERADCEVIACSRVAGAPAALECKLTQIVPLEGTSNFAVFGQVVGVHIRDNVLVDGMIDVTKYLPLARLGYRDYAYIDRPCTLKRPNET